MLSSNKRICIAGPGAVGLDLGVQPLNEPGVCVSSLGRDQRVQWERAEPTNTAKTKLRRMLRAARCEPRFVL